MWHMCALNEQPQRTDQNLMQDELVEIEAHPAVCWGFTNMGQWQVQRLHSVGNAPALETHVYTFTHMDHSPYQHCCARGSPYTHDRSPTSPEGEGNWEGAGPEERQIKGKINVLGVCE